MSKLNPKLNLHTQAALNAIVGGAATREAVEIRCSQTAKQAAASIRSLSTRGLVETTDSGLLMVTPDATQFSTARRRRIGTKMEAARSIFREKVSEGRQAVLHALQEQCKLTANGSITYYQNLRNETGITGVAAMKAVSSRANHGSGKARIQRKSRD